VGELREVLADNLIGVYLHGSGVLGGLRPRSDLDVITVVTRPLSSDEKQRLASVLPEISKRPRHLDFDLVVQSEIRPWRFPPPFDFHYSEWWPGTRDRGTNPDLAVLITMALAGDTPLFGPPAAEVFDAVPREHFRELAAGSADEVARGLETDTRNAVLTLARIWNAMETDDVLSKDDAASWALQRLPEEHRPVLERARAIYRGEDDERWDDIRPQVAEYVAYVVAQVKQAREPA
jgi:aminoglycoside adenylyltransferase-like protein/nucleotidyltransferase-like protein